MDKKAGAKPKKTILTIIFVVLSAAYWIVFYLERFRNLAIPFSVSELIGIGEFLIPIIALVAIVYQIKNLRRKEDAKRSTGILIVMVIVLLCSIGDTYYTAHGVNTAGLFPISGKFEDGGNYYLTLNNELNGKETSMKLECDEETFDNVIIDKKVQYCAEYIWNTLTPQTGYLVDFDLDSCCDNRNNGLVNVFKARTPNELSEAQLDIIKGSATVASDVSEDAGVKITLDSATGDGFYSYYKLDVELPEDMDAGEGYAFGKANLLINDDSIGLGTISTSLMTLEDNDPTDNLYSVLLSIRLTNYPANRDYSFDNGIVRTLRLENIVTSDENGKNVNLIEGQWNFGVLFTNEGKSVELIKEPVTVSGYSEWEQAPFEAKITSFVISEYSAYCEYELTDDSAAETIGLFATAVMKDGSKYALISDGGGSNSYYCYFQVPVSLDEIDYITLAGDVRLNMG